MTYIEEDDLNINATQISGEVPGNDDTAIHTDIANEINPITEKVTPVDADIVLIEDSADSNNKKKVQLVNLLSSGGGTPDLFFYAYNAGVQQILSTNTVLTFDTEVIDDTPFTFTPGGSEVTVNDTANYTIDADMNVESRENLIIKFQIQIDTGAGFADVPGAITYMGA